MTPETLRSFAASLPPETLIPVPAGLVLEILNGGRSEPVADLTVSEAAKLLNRSDSTVRLWCHGGEIPGAYLYRNREYRIPRQALEAFQAEERTRKRDRKPGQDTSAAPVDMGAYKRHLKRAS